MTRKLKASRDLRTEVAPQPVEVTQDFRRSAAWRIALTIVGGREVGDPERYLQPLSDGDVIILNNPRKFH